MKLKQVFTVVLLTFGMITSGVASDSKTFDPYNKFGRMTAKLKQHGISFNTVTGADAQAMYYQISATASRIELDRKATQKQYMTMGENEVLAKEINDRVCVLLSNQVGARDHFQFGCILFDGKD